MLSAIKWSARYPARAGLAATLLAERNPIAFFAIVTPLTMMFILIVLRTTKGGVQWRWGKDEKKK